MTNREQAKMTLYNGIESFVQNDDNNPILFADGPFKDEHDDNYLPAVVLNRKLAEKTGTDNSGFSEQKVKAKQKMAEKIAFYCGRAQIRFENKGRLDLAEQLLTATSDYTGLSDSEAATKARAAITLMTTHQVLLSDAYVSVANIATLTELTDTFEQTQGSSDAAHQAESADTEAFKSSFAPVDKSIKRLRSLARFMVGTGDEELYNTFIEVTRMPAVNVHHTTVNVLVKKKENNEPIEGAHGALSNSDKTGDSDYQGNIHIEQVRNAADAVLTITAAGRKTVALHIAIERGRDNNFEVGMEVE